jgi:DNA-binding IclR family transcriptional regulator
MLSSLGRALDVIELMARERRAMPLGQIARLADMSKSGVHDVLATLADRGYVDRAPGGIYRLGLKAWEVGAAASVTALVETATPIIERLAAQTAEGVMLSVLCGFECVNVSVVESAQAVRVSARIGARFPAHCASVGLALLAFQPESYVDQFMPATLPECASATITDPGELRRELARVRARGYAVSLGGWRSDVGGVGAPILGPAGTAIAGVCIAAPRYRTTKAWLRRIIPAVADAAGVMAATLGSGERHPIDTAIC